jgi:adenosylhomocysteine nucleosidase
MAAPAEYGAHLRARVQPLFVGVGPVEAAVALTAALARLEAADALPDLIVSLGSCGSRGLEHAAVYQASSVAYRDMDASPLGFPRGITPLLDLPAVLPLPCPVPGLPTATLSTGADVVSGAAYDAIDAEMVDMETFALLRAAQVFGVPLVALRGVSDGRSDLTRLEDWTSTLHHVDENLAAAFDRLTDRLGAEGLAVLDPAPSTAAPEPITP